MLVGGSTTGARIADEPPPPQEVIKKRSVNDVCFINVIDCIRQKALSPPFSRKIVQSS